MKMQLKGSDEQQMRSQTATDLRYIIIMYGLFSKQHQMKMDPLFMDGIIFHLVLQRVSYWQGTTINHNFIFGGTS